MFADRNKRVLYFDGIYTYGH